MNKRTLWIYLGFCFFFATCTRLSVLDSDFNPELDIDLDDSFKTAYVGKEWSDTSYFNYEKGVENARKKAQQIASIKWSPKGDIPKWKSAADNTFFFEGHNYKGLPLSSVKEVDTYVGHNVSFYTFMSSINNPRSRIYTEDLSKSPYHGVSCASYYGTVCSMSVNYALGIDAPFICRDYPSIGFEAIAPQDINAIKACDVVWREGHTMMVYDIERDNNTKTVKSVSIFEVNGIRKYSKDEFISRWEEGGFIIMRYKYLGGNLHYEPIPFVQIGDEVSQQVVFNQVICPDKGDKTCYRVGEPVLLNVLLDSVDRIELYDEKGDVVANQSVIDGECRFSDLTPGLYSAKAFIGQKASDAVYFEIVDTTISARIKGNHVIVDFSSKNAIPCYVILCKETGGKYALKQFTETETRAGEIKMVYPEVNSFYVKVAFKGQYGIITNTPILLKR